MSRPKKIVLIVCGMLLTVAIVGSILVRFEVIRFSDDEWRVEGRRMREWVGDLKSKDPQVRLKAIKVVSESAVHAKESIGTLVELLGDDSTKLPAVVALGRMGPLAQEAGPKLRELASKDEDFSVREAAVLAISKVDPNNKDTLAILAAALADHHRAVRSAAGTALVQCGDAGAAVLIKNLTADDPRNRREAMLAVSRLHNGTEVVVMSVLAALQDEDEEVRRAAAVTLGEIGLQTKGVVPALLAALKDDNSSVRRATAETLGRLGALSEAKEHAALVLPALGSLLKTDKVVTVRIASAASIGRFGAQAVSALPALTAALDDKNADVREAAASALGDVGAPANDALPKLRQLLQDPDADVRAAATEAIQAIETPPAPE